MADMQQTRKFASTTTSAIHAQTSNHAALNQSETPAPLQRELPHPSQMPQLQESISGGMPGGYMSFMQTKQGSMSQNKLQGN